MYCECIIGCRASKSPSKNRNIQYSIEAYKIPTKYYYYYRIKIHLHKVSIIYIIKYLNVSLMISQNNKETKQTNILTCVKAYSVQLKLTTSFSHYIF